MVPLKKKKERKKEIMVVLSYKISDPSRPFSLQNFGSESAFQPILGEEGNISWALAHESKKARTSCSPWPALPPDIGGEVLLRLPSYADRSCFGAVCRSWRLSAGQHPLPPRLPCLVFADGTFRGVPVLPEDDRPFCLRAAVGYHVSYGEWLVSKRDDGGYALVNPFSKAVVAPLPSLSSVRAHHEPIRAVGQRDVPEYDMHGLIQRGEGGEGDELEPRTVSVRKLVVRLANLVAAVIGEGRLGKFARCRLGVPSWSVGSHDPWRRVKDMVLHQGKLYAVDHNEDLLTMTIGEDSGGAPIVSRIDRVIKGNPPCLDIHRRVTLHYLVDSGAGGALQIVRREVRRTRPGRGVGIDERFTVLKADFPSSRWVKVSTIGDGTALFVGRWCSRAVRVPDERCEEWTDHIFFLGDGSSDQRQRKTSLLRYSLSSYDMSTSYTYLLLPVMSRDGGDLPVTWLFPHEGTRV